MEGDAGTSQLNPTPVADDAERREAGEGANPTPVADDAERREAGEGANPTEADDSSSEEVNPSAREEAVGHDTQPDNDEVSERSEAVEPGVAERRPSRLGRGWLIGICAALVVLAAAAATGGYLALRSHQDSEAMARADAAAIQAAKDCVAATHAPDAAAMAVSQRKIVECSTGDFGAQATLYSGMLLDAYQAANVQVQVSDMRAAVERHNDDGSVEVLLAVRVKVTNTEVQGQEQGYRLRVQMSPADGQYKISKLDQVTK
jgi:Mce-associated membrane protein